MAQATPIIFRCDGGKQDGLGHVMRCRTLAQAFRDAGCGAINFLTHSPDGVGAASLQSAGFPVTLSPAPAGANADREITIGALRCAAVDGGSPILVCDSWHLAGSYWTACRENAFVVAIDDDGKHAIDADIIVNPHPGALVAAYGASVGQLKGILAGGTYNLIAPVYFERFQRESSERLRLLITMGGEDPSDQTSWLLRELTAKLSECEVFVVVGPAHPKPENVAATAAHCVPHAHILQDVHDMRSLMVSADMALTAGGTTCYELAVMGVPQIGIVLEPHQRVLVRRLADAGCLLPGADYANNDATELRAAFDAVRTSDNRRTAMSMAGRRLFDGPGAQKIVTAVLESYAARVPTEAMSPAKAAI